MMKAPATPKPPQSASKPAEPIPKPADVPTLKSIPAYTGTAPMIMEQRVLPEYCRLTINCAVQLSEQVRNNTWNAIY